MFKLLSDKATMPVRATLGSAGYDLFAAETKMVNFESGNMLIKTNVSTKCPPGTYGRIAIRSSLAYKQHLAVSAGVIDSDYYPGDIGVIVYCTKPGHSYTVTEGERFAQIVFEKIYIGDDEVTTVRNGGYGSTNILDGKRQDGGLLMGELDHIATQYKFHKKPLEGKRADGGLRVGECERDASFTPPVPSNSPDYSAWVGIKGSPQSRQPITKDEVNDMLVSVHTEEHLIDVSESRLEDVSGWYMDKKHTIEPHALSPSLQRLMDGDNDDEEVEFL